MGAPTSGVGLRERYRHNHERTVEVKRIMALTAALSMLALFVLTSQATAQEDVAASVDPEYVSEAGEHTVTVSGTGWTPGAAIVDCPGWGGTAPAASDVDTAAVITNCPGVLSGGTTATSVSDGSFSQEVTVNVPDEGVVLLVFTQSPEAGAVVVVKVGEAMGDDMAPEGGAETGFGGTAGSDGNSVAVPLTAALVGATLLAGAALAVRRDA